MQRGSLGLAGLAGLTAALGACTQSTAPSAEKPRSAVVLPPEAPPTAPARPNEAGHKGSEASCPDHSLVDVERLPPLPESPYAELFQAVWARVLRKHYDPTLGCLDWPGLRQTYGLRLARVQTPESAYTLIRGLLKELGQSHFELLVPGDKSLPNQRIGPASPPIAVRWIEGEAIVVESEAKGPAGGIEPGAKLLNIDHEPVPDIVAALRARNPELRESELAHALRQVVEARLSCQVGHSKLLRVSRPSREDREVVRSIPCVLPEGELVTLGNLTDVPTRVKSYLIEGPNQKIGYLAFNVWMLPMVERVKVALNELRKQGIEALVLDLRGNPGGVGLMAVPVARLFLAAGGSLGALRFRDFTQEFRVEAAPDAFTGPMAILVDEGTASTSEIFTAGMQELGRARVFASRATPGAALPSVIEELPQGVILQYVVGEYRTPRGHVVEGRGVVPDVVVPEPREAFHQGRDPVLEAAITALGGA